MNFIISPEIEHINNLLFWLRVLAFYLINFEAYMSMSSITLNAVLCSWDFVVFVPVMTVKTY